jgi:hypothetical protein
MLISPSYDVGEEQGSSFLAVVLRTDAEPHGNIGVTPYRPRRVRPNQQSLAVVNRNLLFPTPSSSKALQFEVHVRGRPVAVVVDIGVTPFHGICQWRWASKVGVDVANDCFDVRRVRRLVAVDHLVGGVGRMSVVRLGNNTDSCKEKDVSVWRG